MTTMIAMDRMMIGGKKCSMYKYKTRGNVQQNGQFRKNSSLSSSSSSSNVVGLGKVTRNSSRCSLRERAACKLISSRAISTRNTIRLVCHAHASVGQSVSKNRGFVGEMRKVAMKLHTKDQAREGEKEVKPEQVQKFLPTVEGYTRFLIESKYVYDFIEQRMRDRAYSPAFARSHLPTSETYELFTNTGLERGCRLSQDIEYMKKIMKEANEIGSEDIKEKEEPFLAGREYVEYLERLEKNDFPKFICHYYNFYFAHTAGGKMIGNKIANMLLDGYQLEFYKYGEGKEENADVNAMLDRVRDNINMIAEKWSQEEKDACLLETELSFKYSGQLLRLIMS